uniref:DUF4132 domain-containing protein n=1 Tax=Tolypothrix bouteillei VB521301 TaxID=1479485 RepID=A0A0C1RN76_9CYAN
MLNPEQAKAQLQAIRIQDWKQRRVESIAHLPETLREIGWGILGLHSDGQPLAGYWEAREALLVAAKKLDRFNSEERETLFAALFPQIGIYVEQAWQLFSRLPYQSGYLRKSFRVPSNPELTQSRRCDWLSNLVYIVEGYDRDLSWFAAWCAYIGAYTEDTLGILFAAAIDTGDSQGEEIFNILLASARGEHEIGAMGCHVTRALLIASRPDGWAFVENLLLTAQRQEGLRQTILETIDEAHPEAFRRMLRLILEHDLSRFGAIVRAVGVWLGFDLESVNNRVVKEVLTGILGFLESSELRWEVLRSQEVQGRREREEKENAQRVYFALWTLAFEDAIAAIARISEFLNHPDVECRFVAVYLLSQLKVPEAQVALLPAFEDEDLRIVTLALMEVEHPDHSLQHIDIFERLERILPRFPKQLESLQPLVWNWITLKAEQKAVADALVSNLGVRSPKRLLPYLSLMSADKRSEVARILADEKPWDDEIRNALFSLVGDVSSWVQQAALAALATCHISVVEATNLEQRLTRKSAYLRRGILGLLLKQSDEETLASAERLLGAGNVNRRLAGLELLREMIAKERAVSKCQARVREYELHRKKRTTAETELLEVILNTESDDVPTLKDGLGLVDPKELSPRVQPQVQHPRVFVTPAAVACLKSLDNLIHEHRQTVVIIETGQGNTEELLGSVGKNFSAPDYKKTLEEALTRLPLRELWEHWWNERPQELRDADGLDILRVLAPLCHSHCEQIYLEDSWWQEALQTLYADSQECKLRYHVTIEIVCKWLLRLHSPPGAADFLLDAVATIFTLIPEEPEADAPAKSLSVQATLELIPNEELTQVPDGVYDDCDDWENYPTVAAEDIYYIDGTDWENTTGVVAVDTYYVDCSDGFDWWRSSETLLRWLNLAKYHWSVCPQEWNDNQQIRLWQLLHWLKKPSPKLSRHRHELEEVLMAFRLGAATKADLIEQLLVFDCEPGRYELQDLRRVTGRKLPAELVEYPILREVGALCRQRIIEVELMRKDVPTAASVLATAISTVEGSHTLVRLLQAFAKGKFIRGDIYVSSKADVLCHLIRVSFPAESDTPQEFAQQASAAKISQKRLIELAFYAPQWASYVEAALNWSGFAEAVWWIHAHIQDYKWWYVDEEIRETWTAQVSDRTPLSGQNLTDGAVDVDWFARIYKVLGKEKWRELDKVAKYASKGHRYKRVQLFANAMLGQIEKAALVTSITQKRHQDSVRALGLLPLAKGKKRNSDLLERYQIIQDFLRTSRQFGSQKQANELLAARIAMENLARTAGYPDPQRLEWAMEAQAVADLVDNPLTVAVDGVTISLAIAQTGEAKITAIKQGKPLKSIPAKAKKDPKVKELQVRKQEISRQASRMRLSLEQAMCRGDTFTREELQQLSKHPVLSPMLAKLIFLGEEGELGYLVQQGQALQSQGDRITPITSSHFQIAHPYNLLQTGEWHLWQQDCFRKGRTQPFKQVFRELYILTQAEKAEGTISRRYAGHQVYTRQALGLFAQRGWVTHLDEGVRRTFHELGIAVWVTFVNGFFTSIAADGLTIEGTYFSKQGEWKPLPLEEIPPQIFSEAMRDLDLVVSVAHQSSVDPEASASTVEMRASLIRETCRLLKLTNVKHQGSRAFIEGHLGSYSVHLGSGIVHRQPGGALCIVPAYSQHRRRLFLPFADNDPKTAEIVSKVLLLARDKEIQDPTILSQILK